MERRYREGHRTHERKVKYSTEHHKHERHHKHQPERAEKRSSKVPAQSDSRTRPLLDRRQIAPALSGDNDYVRRWLTQTEKEAHDDDGKSDTLQMQSKREDRATKQYPTSGNVTHLQFGLEDTDGRRKPKRRHNSSSDSSLLEVPIRPKSRPLLVEEVADESPETPQREPQHQKKRKSKSAELDISSLSSLPSTPKETFEKRARHKTKEDRYEPKKKRSKSEKATEKKRFKPEKKGDRRKAAKKAGEDLIRNFTSNNIGQERLTIRPSHGLGLFKNGRASSPAKRRGLPDLAFSKMEFLQHSHRDVPTTKPNHIASKFREKDKRKAARVQDEISDFFKPSRVPLREADPNIRGRASSTHTARQDSIYSKQLPVDSYQGMNGHAKNRELAKQLERRISLDRSSTHRGRSPGAYYARKPPDSTSKLSGRANTYITWSETQLSPRPAALPRQQIHFNPQRSPTPASIRRSLRDTGIYHDTGIEIRSESRTSKKEKINAKELEDIRSPDVVNDSEKGQQNLPSSRTGGTSFSESEATDRSKHERDELPIQKYQRLTDLEQNNNDNTEHHQDFHDYVSSMEFNEQKIQPATKGDRRVIIEHFDPVLGWHQRPLSRVHEGRSFSSIPRGESERAAQSTPINREQLAKKARIKRPATTLPITRSTEPENLDKNSLMGGAPRHMHAFEKASKDIQADTETSAAERPKPASTIPPNNKAESSLVASQEEERVASQQDFSKQNIDNDHHDIQHPEKRLSKDEKALRPFTNLESESRVQASVEVDREGTLIRLENSPYLGLPVRGGWNNRAPTSAYEHARVSPNIELEPLFIHQLRRPQNPEERVEPETQPGSGGPLDLVASDLAGNLPVEVNSHDHLSHQENDFTCEDYFYNDQLYKHNYETEENAMVYAHDTHTWEPEEEYVDVGLGHLEMPIGEDHQAWHHYEPLEDMLAEQVVVPTEELVGQSYVRYDGDIHPMQGFWKPRHQY